MSAASKFCGNCGFAITNSSNYCPECGINLTTRASNTQTSTTASPPPINEQQTHKKPAPNPIAWLILSIIGIAICIVPGYLMIENNRSDLGHLILLASALIATSWPYLKPWIINRYAPLITLASVAYISYLIWILFPSNYPPKILIYCALGLGAVIGLFRGFFRKCFWVNHSPHLHTESLFGTFALWTIVTGVILIAGHQQYATLVEVAYIVAAFATAQILFIFISYAVRNHKPSESS